MSICVGTPVEVLITDEGYHPSWADAIVLSENGPDLTCCIQYLDFFEDEEGKRNVTEDVEYSRLRLAMPLQNRPQETLPLQEYRVGSIVDHWHEVSEPPRAVIASFRALADLRWFPGNVRAESRHLLSERHCVVPLPSFTEQRSIILFQTMITRAFRDCEDAAELWPCCARVLLSAKTPALQCMWWEAEVVEELSMAGRVVIQPSGACA